MWTYIVLLVSSHNGASSSKHLDCSVSRALQAVSVTEKNNCFHNALCSTCACAREHFRHTQRQRSISGRRCRVHQAPGSYVHQVHGHQRWFPCSTRGACRIHSGFAQLLFQEHVLRKGASLPVHFRGKQCIFNIYLSFMPLIQPVRACRAACAVLSPVNNVFTRAQSVPANCIPAHE